MKKVLLILIGCFLVQMATAQSYTFRVLANQGQNKIKSSGLKWMDLKTGARLNNGDKLRITSNGYLGLVHSSGKTLELTESGSFDITTLSNKIEENSASIVSKYADYVISKMTPEAIEKNRRKYASVTGSVERGVYDSDIFLYLPKTTDVLNNRATFSWDYSDKNAIYLITLKNIFGEIILAEQVSNLSYTINFDSDIIQSGLISGFIKIEVRLKEKADIKSQEVAVKWMDDQHSKVLKARVFELTTSLGETSPLNNLILAEFYEDNGLILDAITSYEDAVKLSPDIEYFKEAYDEFLIRKGLKKPAGIDSE